MKTLFRYAIVEISSAHCAINMYSRTSSFCNYFPVFKNYRKYPFNQLKKFSVLILSVFLVGNVIAADAVVNGNLEVKGKTTLEGDLSLNNYRYRMEAGKPGNYWFGAHTTVRRISASKGAEMWTGLGRFPYNVVTNVEFNAKGYASQTRGVYQVFKRYGTRRPQIINATTYTREGSERNIEFYGYTDPDSKGSYFLWAKFKNPVVGKQQAMTFTISNNKGIEDSFGSQTIANNESNHIPLDTMMINGWQQRVGIRKDNPVKALHVGAEARFDDVVHANEKILINPQGDISMGTFIEGDQPDNSTGNTNP